MTRFTKLTLSTALALSSMAFVGEKAHLITSSYAASKAEKTNSTTAVSSVQSLYDALAEVTKSKGGIDQRKDIVAPAVDNAFDLEEILHRSIGLHYDTLSADERKDLLKAFRRFTVARYVSTFKPGSQTLFAVTPAIKTNAAGQTLVHSTIGSADDTSDVTSIDYVMKETANGWRITDVLLDGHISQVAAQRSDFKAAFAQGGAKALTRVLNKKADDFLHE